MSVSSTQNWEMHRYTPLGGAHSSCMCVVIITTVTRFAGLAHICPATRLSGGSKAGRRTTQKEVMMELSSVTRPLMALLMSILEVSCSPHDINRDALFSPIHSSGQPDHRANKASVLLFVGTLGRPARVKWHLERKPAERKKLQY